jgi:hypothetical protein
MFTFSERSLNNLKGVHPKLVAVVHRALELSTIDFTVIEGVRSQERQNELWAQGRTKPGPVVTWVQSAGTHGVQGDGSSASAFGFATQTYARIGDGTIGGATGSGGQFGAGVIDILDYASANKNKTVRGLIGVDENGAGRIGLGSGLWQNSSTAISSISITPQAGTLFLQYSSFALYGIKG